MHNTFATELLFILILTSLSLLLINPFQFWMPTSIHITVVALTLTIFSAFSLFIWKAQAIDEREKWHRLVESRISFLSGAFVLICGILFQSFSHQVDLWLVLALFVMFISKIITSAIISVTH